MPAAATRTAQRGGGLGEVTRRRRRQPDAAAPVARQEIDRERDADHRDCCDHPLHSVVSAPFKYESTVLDRKISYDYSETFPGNVRSTRNEPSASVNVLPTRTDFWPC